MTELRFEKKNMKGANFGQHSAYPIFYKQKMFEKVSALDDSEGLFINYGNICHALPFTSLDDYDRALDDQCFSAAVLENDYLKATFIPSLGGRLWSLYDKANKKDLIIDNPVFRPCNLSVRNAWVSGGVEWNCGVRGHSALTSDKIFAAKLKMADGTPVLRLYSFERFRGVTYQMDFFLKDDSKFLFARMRIVNGTEKVTPIYWWSTIAVKQEEGARVIVPADEAYINQSDDPVYKISIPYVDGIDMSYPTNHEISIDHFYKIPEESRKYQCYVKADGSGLIHASTKRLKGRKMFVWGKSIGGENWQKYLTAGEGYNQPYCEIQAGLAPTQNESLPMPPNTAWEWMEAYGAVNFQKEKVHKSWESAKANVKEWLDSVLPEDYMEELLKNTHDEIGIKYAKAKEMGDGWGALDNALKYSQKKKPISAHLDFGSCQKEQIIWERFLKNGYLDEIDPTEQPPSYIVQDEWFEMLKATVKNADIANWYAWYNLGICYFAQDLFEQAQYAFEKSLSLKPSTWGYHGLANTVRVTGEIKRSAYLMAKAQTLNPQDIPLAKETLRFAYEAKEYSLMLSVIKGLEEDIQKEALIKMYKAFSMAHLGQLEEAREILLENGGLEIPDRREGDDSIVDEFIFIETSIAAKNGITLSNNDVKVPKKIDFRMFQSSLSEED